MSGAVLCSHGGEASSSHDPGLPGKPLVTAQLRLKKFELQPDELEKGLGAHLIQSLLFLVEEANPEMSGDLLKITQLIRL